MLLYSTFFKINILYLEPNLSTHVKTIILILLLKKLKYRLVVLLELTTIYYIYEYKIKSMKITKYKMFFHEEL